LKTSLQTNLHLNTSNSQTDLQLQVSTLGICISGEQNIPWSVSKTTLNQELETKGFTNSSIRHLSIEVIHPAFLLLPTTYNDPLYRIAFLEKALGEQCMDGNELHEQACSLVDSTLLYLIPSVWKDQLVALFPLAKIEYTHILGNEIQKSKLYIYPRIQVYLQENHAYVTFFQHGKLQLINVFPYEHELALAYYLHSIRDTFDISWNQECIRLQGPDSLNQKLIEDLVRLNIPLA
jgi:hypothetical protein